MNLDSERQNGRFTLSAPDVQALKALHAVLQPQIHRRAETFGLRCESAVSGDTVVSAIAPATIYQRYFEALMTGRVDTQFWRDRADVVYCMRQASFVREGYLADHHDFWVRLISDVLVSHGADSPLSSLTAALLRLAFLDLQLALEWGDAIGVKTPSVGVDYESVLAHWPMAAALVDEQGGLVFANTAWQELTGMSLSVTKAVLVSQLLPSAAMVRVLPGQQIEQVLELPPQGASGGGMVKLIASALPGQVFNASPLVAMLLEDLRPDAARLQDVLHAQAVAHIGTWQTAAEGQWSLTAHAQRLLGRPGVECMSHAELLACLHGDDRPRFEAQWQAAQTASDFKVECRVQGVGGLRWLDFRGRLEPATQGAPARGYGSMLDVTDRKLAERAMERLAFYDALTGLPNRTYGMMLAQQMLDEAVRDGHRVQLLFVDLDRFKEINETQGHVVGDNVLSALALRLRDTCGPGAVVARLGGDEFMCVRMQVTPEDPLNFAHQVRSALLQPVQVDTRRFEVGASVGVSLGPDHGSDAQQLLKHADIGMCEVKAHGGGCQLYDAELGEQLARRVALGVSLGRALEQSALMLHYQPKVSLRTGGLCGVEALSRWQDAHWGWVHPGEFIPIAEERGLISALGDWTLAQAARDLDKWRRQGVSRLPQVAVNVSAVQMMDDAFAARAASIVRSQGADPSMFELEITESALMHDPQKAQRVAALLVEAGFHLSIDDFGTGFSSLARLQSFPVSKLKIDMSFVRAMEHDPGNLAIVSAVISLARALKLATVAEGVEHETQAQLLRDLHCDEAQGWLYSKAVTPGDLRDHWLVPTPAADAPR